MLCFALIGSALLCSAYGIQYVRFVKIFVRSQNGVFSRFLQLSLLLLQLQLVAAAASAAAAADGVRLLVIARSRR